MGSLFAMPISIPSNDRCFPDLPEAIASILAFCIKLGIPKPSLMVFTGGGLHVYWLSDKMLTVEDWQPFADGLKAAMRDARVAGQGYRPDRGLCPGATGAGHVKLQIRPPPQGVGNA